MLKHKTSFIGRLQVRLRQRLFIQPQMRKKYTWGLQLGKNAPEGKILKSDVTVAKNYLNKAHIEELNRIISAYLDLAETRAKKTAIDYDV